MSIRQNVLCSTRFAVLVAGIALAAAPAFAGYNNNPPPPSSCYSNCGGSSVPEPSTLALLGVTIPGAAAWIKRKLAGGAVFSCAGFGRARLGTSPGCQHAVDDLA
jgi:hypothetical protein